jgi:hypothetical protein
MDSIAVRKRSVTPNRLSICSKGLLNAHEKIAAELPSENLIRKKKIVLRQITETKQCAFVLPHYLIIIGATPHSVGEFMSEMGDYAAVSLRPAQLFNSGKPLLLVKLDGVPRPNKPDGKAEQDREYRYDGNAFH